MSEERKKERSKRRICVFDFDETIVDDNSDTFVLSLLPSGVDMWKYYEQGEWTKLMDKMMEMIHSNNKKKEDIEHVFSQIKLVEGFHQLITQLGEEKEEGEGGEVELVVLSDANTFFISTILEQKKLDHFFSTIISNCGQFDEEGRLRVHPKQGFYHQTSHGCRNCPHNLCKGKELREIITERSNKDKEGKEEEKENKIQISYFGDGRNDLCAALQLQKGDLLFPRKGKTLEGLVEEEKGRWEEKGVGVCVWENGFECWDYWKKNA